MTPEQTARQVRHALTLHVDPTAAWHCRICGEGGPIGQATPCEGACGAWMHWACYWPAMLSPAERIALAAAEIADDQRDDTPVEVWIQDRQFRLPAVMLHSAVEDFLEHQIALCPGCRS